MALSVCVCLGSTIISIYLTNESSSSSSSSSSSQAQACPYPPLYHLYRFTSVVTTLSSVAYSTRSPEVSEVEPGIDRTAMAGIGIHRPPLRRIEYAWRSIYSRCHRRSEKWGQPVNLHFFDGAALTGRSTVWYPLLSGSLSSSARWHCMRIRIRIRIRISGSQRWIIFVVHVTFYFHNCKFISTI